MFHMRQLLYPGWTYWRSHNFLGLPLQAPDTPCIGPMMQ